MMKSQRLIQNLTSNGIQYILENNIFRIKTLIINKNLKIIFIQIGEPYFVLSDKDKRAIYDGFFGFGDGFVPFTQFEGFFKNFGMDDKDFGLIDNCWRKETKTYLLQNGQTSNGSKYIKHQ
ncbi:unnamed protein product [Paramecium sonneborni]|uniref:Uncharacterized protein n=1 Tax=Paramecium sonneborni TaxID=65129 RepID=A0A8S1N302_9CILI|nr:unnamed protein product [Paramecium sonneborni]